MCPCRAFYDFSISPARYLGFSVFGDIWALRDPTFPSKKKNWFVQGLAAADRWQWKCDVANKRSYFITRRAISVPLAMSTNIQKKLLRVSKKKPKNIVPGQILGQVLIRSGEIPSPRQTSIDKTDDCAMKSERGSLVRGSDPSSGHSVHKTTSDMWRAPARRLIHTHLVAAV